MCASGLNLRVNTRPRDRGRRGQKRRSDASTSREKRRRGVGVEARAMGRQWKGGIWGLSGIEVTNGVYRILLGIFFAPVYSEGILFFWGGAKTPD